MRTSSGPAWNIPGWPNGFPAPAYGKLSQAPAVAALKAWLEVPFGMQLSDADVRAMRNHWRLAAEPLIERVRRTGSAE